MVSLEEVCKKNGLYFQTTILESKYCLLAMERKISCCYLGEKDENGFCLCRYGEECELTNEDKKLPVN